MSSLDTWRDQIRDILDTCTCTPPPIGEGPQIDCPMHGRADYQADAVMPILNAALKQQAEDIAQELQQAAEDHERTIADIARVAEPRRTGISAGLRRAVPIARQHIADGAPDA